MWPSSLSTFAFCLLFWVTNNSFISAARSHHNHHLHGRRHREGDGPSLESRSHECIYQNITYAAGEKFRPDSCTSCHCPKRGGRAVCSVEDCRYDPGCTVYETQPDECCGRCIERGCLHSDGKVYPKGTELHPDPCTKCFCPKDSQHTVCLKVECPFNMCVDSIRLPNRCCSYCPRGPNCRYKNTVLPANQIVRVDNCTICNCPNPLRMRSVEAQCVNTCELKERLKSKISARSEDSTDVKNQDEGLSLAKRADEKRSGAGEDLSKQAKTDGKE